MLVVRVTENVRAVQSSYYSSCPCAMRESEEKGRKAQKGLAQSAKYRCTNSPIQVRLLESNGVDL
jgi:hypothetical protein